MRTFSTVLLCFGISHCVWVSPARAGSHLEASFAFLGGERNYENATFSYANGTASPSLGGSFHAPPFSGVNVAGVAGEAVLVVNGVRFTIGYQTPYARLTTEQQNAPLATEPVHVHGLDISEMRYGLGYDVDLQERISVFADLIGTADKLAAKLTVSDQHSTYESKNFSYSIRLGGRYAITKQYFAHASVEFGLDANIAAGAYGGVGVRIP